MVGMSGTKLYTLYAAGLLAMQHAGLSMLRSCLLSSTLRPKTVIRSPGYELASLLLSTLWVQNFIGCACQLQAAQSACFWCGRSVYQLRTL
jgi:hypothetical protein